MPKMRPQVIPHTQKAMRGMRIWEIEQNQKVHLADKELEQRATKMRTACPFGSICQKQEDPQAHRPKQASRLKDLELSRT
jgi:hypothetical protein